jgi:hypothetical protein
MQRSASNPQVGSATAARKLKQNVSRVNYSSGAIVVYWIAIELLQHSI